MGYFAKKDLLSDDAIKSEYYEKYLGKIKANTEFQKLVSIVNEANLQIEFYFEKGVYGRTLQYSIGFEICNMAGEPLVVPRDSLFFDVLNCLVTDYPVVAYKKLRKTFVLFELDENELSEDCKLFSEFLYERHMANP